MTYESSFATLKDSLDCAEPAGVAHTNIPQVRFFWSTKPVPKAPLLYRSGLVIMGQGHKIAHFKGRMFRYDSTQFLITNVPAALECETHASAERPTFGIFVDIDVPRLREMVETVNRSDKPIEFDKRDLYAGIEPVRMDAPMRAAVCRLLDALASPTDSDVLGQALVREVIYRALQGEHGKALAAVTLQDTHQARIARVLSHVHEHYMELLSVEALCDMVNMSPSAFHRAFKAVTGDTPLQYQKKVRLENARFLILREGARVSVAANRVGYESVSQFSREFKRHFAVPPNKAAQGAYAEMYR